MASEKTKKGSAPVAERTITTTLPFEKETKNTFKFGLPDSTPDDVRASSFVDAIYVKKTAFSKRPEQVTLTITPE